MDMSKEESTANGRPSSSDDSAFETEGLLRHSPNAAYRGTKRLQYSLLFLFGLLVALSSSVITATVLRHRTTPNRCEDLSVDGSSLSGIDRSWHLEWSSPFNYSGSPFTADPKISDPDAAWRDIGVDYDYFVIPPEQGAIFGLDPQHNAMHVDENGDVTGYMAVLESVHQLHCLNALRKNLWYNHDHYASTSHKASLPVRIAHLNHCVDALREKLMCGADIGVVPWVWSSQRKFVIQPHFVRQHRCHDFEAVRDWARERQVRRVVRKEELVVPEDAVLTPLFGEVPF